MGLLIEGMNMPNACINCDLHSVAWGNYKCTVSSKIIKDELTRPNDCPLVEVHTPHGRLIDADRFLDWLKEFHPTDVAIMSGIKNARTVIDAEVDE